MITGYLGVLMHRYRTIVSFSCVVFMDFVLGAVVLGGVMESATEKIVS